MIGVSVLIGVMTAASVALLVRGVRAPLPSLGDRVTLVLHGVTVQSPMARLRDQLVGRTPADVLPDIALLGRTPGEVVTTRLLWAAAATTVVTLIAVGLGLPVLLVPPVALAAAAAGWLLALHELRDAAAKRRRTLGLALSAWTQMAAMMIRAGMGVDQALHVAATRGNHWAFDMIARTLRTAVEQQVPVWRALLDLGTATGVAELRQLAEQLHLSESVGGSPSEALIARAQLLREEELAGQLEAAKRAEVKQAVPLAMLGICLVVYTLWPAMETFVNT